jgi:hypothetical protein
MATSSSTTKTIVIKVEGGQAIASMDDVTLSTKQLNAELAKISVTGGKGKAGGASGATGGATATVLELGRTISDSNYGIRGMANNISQLASNFLFMTRKVDETTKQAIGFGGALKQVGSTILGPLGILLAIQAVIAVMEKISMTSGGAEKGLDDFRESAAKAGTDLKILLNQVERGNISNEDLAKSVKKANDEYKDLNISIDDNGKLTEESTKAIKKQILALEELALANAIQDEVQKLQAKVVKQTLEARKQFSKEMIDSVSEMIEADEQAKEQFLADGGIIEMFYGKLDEFEQGSPEALAAASVRSINRAKEAVSELTDIFGEEGIVNKIFGDDDDRDEPKAIKSFKQRLLDLSKITLKFQRDEELATEENEFKKLEIKQKYEREDLQNRHDSFIEKERLRLENFLKTTENEAKIAEAKATFNKMELQAEKEHQDALTELTMTQASKRFNFQLEIARESTKKYQEAVDAGEIQALTFGMTQDAGVDALNAEAVLLQAQYDQKVYWLDEEIKERKRDGDSYMDLLKQKLNAETQFNNDKLVLTEKTEEAKLDIVQYGFEVIASIAEKGSAIGKAAAVAATLMSTRKAAVAALGAEPYGPWNIAQAALVTAMGLSNVNKILNTPIPTRNGGTTTGGATVGGDRTFDFNLVGSTGTNQLAEAVGSQFQEPVQAYVVSSQMTSQQELDLQISTGASLGGD